MNVMEFIKRTRGAVTVVLALAGIAVMAFYAVCDTSCSYLQGAIWGIDLKWIGTAYMSAIIVFAALKCTALVRAMLAAGLGVEVFLITFQFKEDVFCPFCLAFAVIVIAAFIINYERSDRLKGSWRDKILYALGEFTWPPAIKFRIPLLLFAVLGYLFVFLTFSGSATPAYGDVGKSAPSWGSGNYEVFVFSDYFCPPCQALETELEPALEAMLAQGGVKVTFVDLPIHKPTMLYNRYYLYAVNADADIKKVLQARRALFHFAKQSPTANAASEETLADLFKKANVAFKPFDYKPVQAEFTKFIRRYKVDSTPTCIVKYSESDLRRYEGPAEIMDGIRTLQANLKKGAR